MASRGNAFLEQLNERILVGDGAMGSRLYELGMSLNASSDYINIARPEMVRQVHQEYFDAGAQLLETNTFSANRIKLGAFGLDKELAIINQSAVKLAKEVAGDKAFVAGSVGPLPFLQSNENVEQITEEQAREAFREQVTILADAGADLIQLETFTDFDQIRWALSEAKSCCDLPVIAQMSIPDGRHTPDGMDAFESLETLHREGADVVGTNCGNGVARVLRVIEYLGNKTDAKLSAYPNAGMPEQVDGRFLYLTTPKYMAESAEQMVLAGANLIGGCCGTTAANIAAIAKHVCKLKPVRRMISVRVKPTTKSAPVTTPPPPVPEFLSGLKKRTVILVELDPPKTTDLQKMLHGAKAIKEAGADAITLGDSPLAQVRMNGLMIGSMIEKTIHIPVIAHLACRDRNLIGTQSLLLGAHALGIRSILALTGDPAKVGNHPDASSVYDLNSFSLIEMIMKLNQGQNRAGQSIGRPTAFNVGVAFNPNKRDVTPEVRRLKRKVDRGATFALTQAVFDAEAMRIACEAARDLGIPIFAGVFPLLSTRHAEFLHNEFPGITVCESVRQRMAAAAPDKQQMAKVGMDIAKELIDAFMECADGLYLIPPLNRAAIAVELINYVRSKERVAHS